MDLVRLLGKDMREFSVGHLRGTVGEQPGKGVGDIVWLDHKETGEVLEARATVFLQRCLELGES